MHACVSYYSTNIAYNIILIHIPTPPKTTPHHVAPKERRAGDRPKSTQYFNKSFSRQRVQHTHTHTDLRRRG